MREDQKAAGSPHDLSPGDGELGKMRVRDQSTPYGATAKAGQSRGPLVLALSGGSVQEVVRERYVCRSAREMVKRAGFFIFRQRPSVANFNEG